MPELLNTYPKRAQKVHGRVLTVRIGEKRTKKSDGAGSYERAAFDEHEHDWEETAHVHAYTRPESTCRVDAP